MEQTIDISGSIPDEVLANRILAGEKRLFELIIRKYNQRLFRVGMSILHDQDEAEDAMQTAYIKAYEHLADFGNRSSLGTWLTRIMLNECLASKNKKQRRNQDLETKPPNITTMSTPDNTLVNKELSGMLETAISRLPEKYRTVFILREMEDMSVKETGDVLAIGEANVKVRLNRAKSMLRDYLNGYLKDQVYAFHLSRCDRMENRVFAQLGI
jgi:RNA polymerase sigma-70 factor (ECF subfamily)